MTSWVVPVVVHLVSLTERVFYLTLAVYPFPEIAAPPALDRTVSKFHETPGNGPFSTNVHHTMLPDSLRD